MNYEYSYYNKTDGTGVIATNLKAIEDASGIKYHTLRYWFRNGTDVKETKEFILFRSEPIKGKQRVAMQSGQRQESPPEERDEFDKLLQR